MANHSTISSIGRQLDLEIDPCPVPLLDEHESGARGSAGGGSPPSTPPDPSTDGPSLEPRSRVRQVRQLTLVDDERARHLWQPSSALVGWICRWCGVERRGRGRAVVYRLRNGSTTDERPICCARAGLRGVRW